jgi:hypothetical protein
MQRVPGQKVLTVLGPITLNRAYYYDEKYKKGWCPKDTAFNIEETSLSPGVRRIVARAGASDPFALGHQDIKEMAGLEVDPKEIDRVSHRIGEEIEAFYQETPLCFGDSVSPRESISKMYICMDGTGVPVVKAETVNRKGKGEEGEAKTREAKLGFVFTQTQVDEKGYPVRDEGSTSYAGAIETAEAFGKRIYEEAWRRGEEEAPKVCVIGDGSPWIWNIAEEHFYGATQIIDLYHAQEHYWKVAHAVFGFDRTTLDSWTDQRRKELDRGEVEAVIEAIQGLSHRGKEQKEICEKESGYFEKNKDRMRYDDFTKNGLFIGSGVVEADCRTVIGQRLKQSSMFWTVKGANSIIVLWCCLLSNRWEDFWEYRAWPKENTHKFVVHPPFIRFRLFPAPQCRIMTRIAEPPASFSKGMWTRIEGI